MRLERRDPPAAWDRGNPVSLTFDDLEIIARDGEPLMAALLAAGVRVLRTMPKSGEARGGYCLVGRCNDCLVAVDGEPNVRACVTPVRPGMRVQTQVALGPAGPLDVSDGDPGASVEAGQ